MSERVLFGAVALLSSASWALGAILWKRLGNALTPGGMNFAKVVLGSVLLTSILPLSESAPMESRSLLLLGASGLVGIALGDTFFYMSLVKLGPRRAALMGCLNPVFIALASPAFLGERLEVQAWAGIVVSTLGVAWVLHERTPSRKDQVDARRGVLFGILSVLCTTTSVLFAKVGLVAMSSVQAAQIRLVCAAAGLALFGTMSGRIRVWLRTFRSLEIFLRVSVVVPIVVLGGFWLSLLALKHLEAAIAGTLTSMSPVLILPMAYFAMKERLSARAVAGAFVAVGGIALIFLAG